MIDDDYDQDNEWPLVSTEQEKRKKKSKEFSKLENDVDGW
jgi:hypothetical protein